MTVDDVPVLVFSGLYTEAVFLISLLESAGIDTSAEHTRDGSRIFVRQLDVEGARELVEDFEGNGRRTTP